LNLTILNLLEKKLIWENLPDAGRINDLLTSASTGLEGACQDIGSDPVLCVTQAYDAIFDACYAYMLLRGYETATKPDYAVVLRFCEITLEPESADTLKAFEAAENRRHKEMYTGGYSMNEAEAGELLVKAKTLIDRIRTMVT
jgi:uncharacterized protein (UPF0332 family)